MFCIGFTSYLKLNTTNLDVPLSEIVKVQLCSLLLLIAEYIIILL